MSFPRTITSAALAVLLCAASACNDEAPPFELRYETEHLRIGVADDGELCGGDLARLEAHVTNVEGLLSTELEGKVDVYMWPFLSKGVEDYCTYDAGCYRRETKTIYAKQSALGHELVHAVAIPLGDPSAMWSEGIAEALDTRRVFPGSVAPTDNFFRDNSEVNYSSAGHFVRWVRETHGGQAVRDLLTDTRDLEVAFEAITGQTLEQAESDYYEQSPWSFGVLVSCQVPKLEQSEEAGLTRWIGSAAIDCANDETLSGTNGYGIFRTFEVVERGDFQFVSDASTVMIQRCPDEDLPARPEEDDPEQGDVPASSPGVPEGPVLLVEAQGEGEVLDLAAGRYELILVVEEAKTVSVEVSQVEGAP